MHPNALTYIEKYNCPLSKLVGILTEIGWLLLVDGRL
jgi:hypothetical protein